MGGVLMKIFISSTEYAIVIDTKEASLWEWLQCLEEQYPLSCDFCETKRRSPTRRWKI